MSTESQIIRSLTELVADALADQRLRADSAGDAATPEQELELAKSTVIAELARFTAKRPLDSWPPLDETMVVDEVIAHVLGHEYH